MDSLTYRMVTEAGLSVIAKEGDPFEPLRSCQPRTLGPLIELALLFDANNVPLQRLKALFGRTRTLDAVLLGMTSGMHFWEDTYRAVGIVACEGSLAQDPSLCKLGVHEASELYLNRWSKFASELERSSQLCGVSKRVAEGFAGVVQELQDNIFEHSCKPNSGLVGFRRNAGTIEIVVADAGVGILGGFRSVGRTEFSDHSEALRAVVFNGQSRFAEHSGRANGLRQIFAQLATLQGDLRFRTGDTALSISGNNFSIDQIEESVETTVSGFLVSILIRPRAAALFAE
jgi:anti-sigma regulatory factor (Ser/Thr protein kinase)